mmetsp:Transcript_8457/g.12881  ORF Transcript_8457/g.12881 Transcript_8457/m.12881 type:complete len:357 (+) Transcript_8457:192-1262(+)
MSKHDRSALQDVFSSVVNHGCTSLTIQGINGWAMKPSKTLRIALSLQDENDQAIPVLRSHFDRLVGNCGALYFVDCSNPDDLSYQKHFWLYIQAVVVRNGAFEPAASSRSTPPFLIHDLNCDNCKRAKHCKSKDISILFGSAGDKSIIQLNFLLNRLCKTNAKGEHIPYFFYFTTLNCPQRAAVSSRVFCVNHPSKLKNKPYALPSVIRSRSDLDLQNIRMFNSSKYSAVSSSKRSYIPSKLSTHNIVKSITDFSIGTSHSHTGTASTTNKMLQSGSGGSDAADRLRRYGLGPQDPVASRREVLFKALGMDENRAKKIATTSVKPSSTAASSSSTLPPASDDDDGQDVFQFLLDFK